MNIILKQKGKLYAKYIKKEKRKESKGSYFFEDLSFFILMIHQVKSD